MNLFRFPPGYVLGFVFGVCLMLLAAVVLIGGLTAKDNRQPNTRNTFLAGFALLVSGGSLLILSSYSAWSDHTNSLPGERFITPLFILVLTGVLNLSLPVMAGYLFWKHQCVNFLALFTMTLAASTAVVDAYFWRVLTDFTALLVAYGWIVTGVSFFGTLAAFAIRFYGTQQYNRGYQAGQKPLDSADHDWTAAVPHGESPATH